jgi:hypothetical protein
MFGGNAASNVTVLSDSQITADAPAGSAGTVDVTVTTVGGTSATSSSDQYTYVAAPVVTGVSPSSGSTDGGTTVTISGSGFAGASSVMFGTNSATVFTVVSDTQITADSPARSAGTVDVTVTTLGGTSATSSADQFTYQMEVTLNGVGPSSGPNRDGELTS